MFLLDTALHLPNQGCGLAAALYVGGGPSLWVGCHPDLEGCLLLGCGLLLLLLGVLLLLLVLLAVALKQVIAAVVFHWRTHG